MLPVVQSQTGPTTSTLTDSTGVAFPGHLLPGAAEKPLSFQLPQQRSWRRFTLPSASPPTSHSAGNPVDLTFKMCPKSSPRSYSSCLGYCRHLLAVSIPAPRPHPCCQQKVPSWQQNPGQAQGHQSPASNPSCLTQNKSQSPQHNHKFPGPSRTHSHPLPLTHPICAHWLP